MHRIPERACWHLEFAQQGQDARCTPAKTVHSWAASKASDPGPVWEPCTNSTRGVITGNGHAVSYKLSGFAFGGQCQCCDRADAWKLYLPQYCAETETASHHTPQQATPRDDPDPVEVMSCVQQY